LCSRNAVAGSKIDDNAGLEAGHSTQNSASEDNMLVGQETYVVDNGVDNIDSLIDTWKA
jgi:hypothetical protein